MMLRLRGNTRARSIGHCHKRRHCVNLWSEIGSSPCCVVQPIKRQQEAPGWVIVWCWRSVCIFGSWSFSYANLHYGLWKSLPAVQRYLEHFDAISPDTSAWLFFWLDDASRSSSAHNFECQFSRTPSPSTSAAAIFCEPVCQPE